MIAFETLLGEPIETVKEWTDLGEPKQGEIVAPLWLKLAQQMSEITRNFATLWSFCEYDPLRPIEDGSRAEPNPSAGLEARCRWV